MTKFTKIGLATFGISATNAVAIPLVCNTSKSIEIKEPLKPIFIKWTPPTNSKGVDKKAVETVNKYDQYASCLSKGRLESTCKSLLK